MIAKTLILTLFISGIFALSPLSITQANEKPEPIDVDITKIEYNLPFPGILPDHPLYPLKSARDTIKVFLTRDYMKKADLLLLLSDKYASMAVALAEDGQWGTAAEAVEQSESSFTDMIDALETSKEQGVSPSAEFLQKIKLSNDKHKEVIQELLITSPQGSHTILEESLEKNNQLRDDIKKLSDR